MCIIRTTEVILLIRGGAYNQYAFTQQENGEVTMKMMKEGYERPYKRSNTFLWANKAEAGTREKIAHIL